MLNKESSTIIAKTKTIKPIDVAAADAAVANISKLLDAHETGGHIDQPQLNDHHQQQVREMNERF